MQRYVRLDEIGHGSYGKVYELLDTTTGTLYALKCIRNLHPSAGIDQTVVREVDIGLRIDHQNVASILSYSEGKNPGDYNLRMEKADYSLYDFMKGRDFPHHDYHMKLYINYMAQAANGLLCLHKNGIAHLDVKPHNTLLYVNDVLKIADFGLAEYYFMNSKIESRVCYSPTYRPPEIKAFNKGSTFDPELSDVYALGVMYLQMLTPFSMWRDYCMNGVGEFIAHDKKYYMEELERSAGYMGIEYTVNPALIDLIYKMLNPVPEQRPRLMEIVEHDVFNGIKLAPYKISAPLIVAPYGTTETRTILDKWLRKEFEFNNIREEAYLYAFSLFDRFWDATKKLRYGNLGPYLAVCLMLATKCVCDYDDPINPYEIRTVLQGEIPLMANDYKNLELEVFRGLNHRMDPGLLHACINDKDFDALRIATINVDEHARLTASIAVECPTSRRIVEADVGLLFD